MYWWVFVSTLLNLYGELQVTLWQYLFRIDWASEDKALMTDLVASSEEMSCLWNLSTEETEAEGQSVKGQPELHNKFQSSSHAYTRRAYHIKQMIPPLQPPFSTSSASQKILSKYRHFRAFLLTAPASGNTWNKTYIESQKSFSGAAKDDWDRNKQLECH